MECCIILLVEHLLIAINDIRKNFLLTLFSKITVYRLKIQYLSWPT